ncbi:MAG: glycosyltransferase [Candidatus Korobacteraceae bacterium]
MNNDGINRWNVLTIAVKSIYAPSSRRSLEQEIGSFQPDVVHVHNFFPRLSPSIYFACQAVGVPVVQTLHNYRLICPGALLFRDGAVCEACVGKEFPWPGVLHGCYQQSRMGTAAVASMTSVHRWLNTWVDKVSGYIALTCFAREKFVSGGLPTSKISVKPNFVTSDAGPGEGKGEYALFVGRLSPEKGITTLLKAWAEIGRCFRLKVLGDGPLRAQMSAAAPRGIECLGWRPQSEVQEIMRNARFLVFPSEWYEGFPVTLAQAFAAGLPVVASDLGGMAEIVSHGRTGLLFRAGDANDLGQTISLLLQTPELLPSMRVACRADYDAKYTPERNYQILAEIYRRAGVPSFGTPER